jgi:hypothetical protein
LGPAENVKAGTGHSELDLARMRAERGRNRERPGLDGVEKIKNVVERHLALRRWKVAQHFGWQLYPPRV